MIFFAVVLFILFLFRLWLSGFGGIHPDEAYYWYWSLKPQFGYFDHPPAISWIIAAGERFVHFFISSRSIEVSPTFFSIIGLKIFPFFLSCFCTPLVLAKTIVFVQRKELRLLQMFVLLSTPLFVFGGQVVTPDAPFFFFWSLVLYLSVRLYSERKPESRPGDPTPLRPKKAVALGLALGLCAYSKFSAILAAFIIVISGAGLSNSIIVALAALLLYAPYLVWNYVVALPRGAGIFFQLKNGLGGLDQITRYQRMGDLILTQIFAWSPVVFFGVFLILARDLRRCFGQLKNSYLSGTFFVWSIVPLLFFCLTSLRRPAEANWPLIGSLAATILFVSRFRESAFWLLVAFFSNVVTVIASYLILTHHPILKSLAAKVAPSALARLDEPSRLQDFENWDRIHQFIFEETRSPPAPVMVQSYQYLSEFLFFDKHSAEANRFGDRLKIWAEGSRLSQFNFDPDFYTLPDVSDHWIVAYGDHPGVPNFCKFRQKFFKSPLDTRAFSVYWCAVDKASKHN